MKKQLLTGLILLISATAQAETKQERPSVDNLLGELLGTALVALDAAADSPAGKELVRDSASLLMGLAGAIEPKSLNDIENMTIGELGNSLNKSAKSLEQVLDKHQPQLDKAGKIAEVIGNAVGQRAGDLADTAVSELKMTGFLLLQEALSQNDDLREALKKELADIK